MTAMTHQKARVRHTWAFALSADGSSYTQTSGNRKPGTERPQAGEGIWGGAALFNGIRRVLAAVNRGKRLLVLEECTAEKRPTGERSLETVGRHGGDDP